MHSYSIPGVELSTIVDAINAVGASPADLVAILEALREAGSLRAEVVSSYLSLEKAKSVMKMEVGSQRAMDQMMISQQYKRENTPENLREAAEFFEAMFLNQMMKQARDASLADDLFGNKGSETYTELLDQERSQSMAQNMNLGIADALVRQFRRERGIGRVLGHD